MKCSKCRAISDINPEECESWRCEYCGQVNAITVEPQYEPGSGRGWLDENGICHFDGPESELPLGGYSNVPNWGPEKAAKRWEIDDPESEEGKALKKTADLLPTDFITGVQLNEKTLKGHVYKIRDANGGPLRPPIRNNAKDELALVAIRNMRQILAGKRKIINI